MATFIKQKLSASTNGRPIEVAATASPGTTIHTATNTGGDLDEIWLYAINTDTVTRSLTIELGGTLNSDQIIVGIPSRSGLVLIVPGFPLDGGVIVKAFADAVSKINIVGFVNNIAS